MAESPDVSTCAFAWHPSPFQLPFSYHSVIKIRIGRLPRARAGRDRWSCGEMAGRDPVPIGRVERRLALWIPLGMIGGREKGFAQMYHRFDMF